MLTSIAKGLSALPLVAVLASAQPTLGPHPTIPSNLQISTYATGLSFPYGLYQLPDGSTLVATNTGSLYGSATQILRITETNGVANAPQNVFTSSGAGPATGITGVGDIVAVAIGVNTGSQIVLFRAGVGGSLTKIGELNFTYPGAWWHDSHAIALRAVAGQPNNFEIVFNIGSEFNAAADVNTVSVSGLINGTLGGSSIYSVPLTITGNTVTAGASKQLAKGLRNAFGLGFAANGDIVFSENGIDLGNSNTPVSTDYLAKIPVGTANVLDFGFPNTYYDPITGQTIGSPAGITSPYLKFLPQNGMAVQGAGGLLMTSAGFLGSQHDGAFVGFFGNRFNGIAQTLGGVAYVDFTTGQYYNFLPNTQTGVNHTVSMYASSSALYIADIGDIFGDPAYPGVIYRVSVTTVPEPSTFALVGVAGLFIFVANRRRRSASRL